MIIIIIMKPEIEWFSFRLTHCGNGTHLGSYDCFIFSDSGRHFPHCVFRQSGETRKMVAHTNTEVKYRSIIF